MAVFKSREHHFFLGAFSFLAASLVSTAVTAGAATATGVYRVCLLWTSTARMEPASAAFLRRMRAMEPTILNFSMSAEVLMCLPSLGMAVRMRS